VCNVAVLHDNLCTRDDAAATLTHAPVLLLARCVGGVIACSRAAALLSGELFLLSAAGN